MNNVKPHSTSTAELVNQDSFERLKNKNRHKEIRRKLFSILIAVLLCLLLIIVCIVLFFGMKSTVVTGNIKYSDEEIISACGFDSSTNLFGIDFDDTSAAIKKQLPYIDSISFERKLPSTLLIKVNEDAPTFYTEISGDWFILSNNLRIISRYDSKGSVEIQDLGLIRIMLPEVSYAVTGEEMRFVRDANRDFIIKFIDQLNEINLIPDIQCIDASDRYHICIYSSNGRFKILVGDASELDVKLLFTSKVIDSAFGEMTVATINAEQTESVVVLKQNERFVFD